MFSASTATIDSSPGRGGGSRTADYDFASVFAAPTVTNDDSAEAPAATTSLAQPTPYRRSVQGTDPAEPTGQTPHVSTSPGSPPPQTMTPFSDRISTRKRRRSATGAGMEHPAVDYRCGPGGAPRPSSRGVTNLPQARRSRLAPPAAATPTLADQPARAVPLPPDHDHAEPMGTPLLRHTSPPGDTPATPTRSDALDDAAELRFADSAARYSHADWKREQHADPTRNATIRYISIGRPSALPPDVLTCYPSPKRPSLSDIQELASEGRLHTTDDDIVLLVPNPTLPPTSFDKPNPVGRAACWLNDEPTRIYVPLLMRPWIMQACHSTASCHLGATRTLRMLECFN